MRRRYFRLEDQKSGPNLVQSVGFAKGRPLEPKVQWFQKCVKLCRRGKQTNVAQAYHIRGTGGRSPQLLGDFFCNFLEKIAILMPFG